MTIDEIIDDLLKESEVDYVGLWQIAQESREDLGGAIDGRGAEIKSANSW
jgi:hypothetical protein